MALRESGIEWTHYSGNAWIGCTAVGPGCNLCYANARFAKRLRMVEWGAGKSRHKVKGFAANVRKASRQAADLGGRQRFFVNSASDTFDNEVPDEWREEVWATLRQTDHLDFILVTKRIGNVAKMLPEDWGVGYSNTWLLATMVNQEELDRDMPKLAAVPAVVRGLSIEPIMGPVDLSKWLHLLDWVIIGGQSQQMGDAEPLVVEYEWVRALIDQCLAAGIAVFFKQWGTGHYPRGGNVIDGEVIEMFPNPCSGTPSPAPWQRDRRVAAANR
ncbi:DUF5131 family protein [uncultured Sneathiella sp.]|uniref:DUF5131 family protein n=1 Tax=uncultured Sneathiella sp. TaxID=879315 RepID=UPI0030EBBD76